MTTQVPQLLMVWNPLVEPRTVKVHVDLLQARASSADRYVWWGRIYAGSAKMDKATLRKKWKHVLDLEKQARKESRSLVLFATDYQSLHALRVERVKLGPGLPEDSDLHVPDYYLEEDRRVALWFKVRDVRAVTHYQLRTLEYFREMMGPVKDSFSLGSRLPYDPYAAFKYAYPIIVDGPSERHLFDPAELARRSSSANGFADLKETVFPPDLQTILDALAGRLDFLWDDLRDNTRIFLACAQLVEQRYRSLNDFDFSAALCEVAKAVETEMIDGLLSRIFRLPDEIVDNEIIREYRPARKRPRSMGSAAAILRDLGGMGSLSSELSALAALCDPGGEWMSWLGSFRKLRNEALHNELIGLDRYQSVWEDVFARNRSVGLVPVVRARQEVEAFLRA